MQTAEHSMCAKGRCQTDVTTTTKLRLLGYNGRLERDEGGVGAACECVCVCVLEGGVTESDGTATECLSDI